MIFFFFQALIHGLNRHYYSISINYRKNELEQKMLLNLHKKSWMDGLMLADYTDNCKINENTVGDMLELAKNYNKVFLIYLYFSALQSYKYGSVYLEPIILHPVCLTPCLLLR